MKIILETQVEEEINIEILNCPYCGSPHLRIVRNFTYQVFCRQCAAKGSLSETWEKAVAAWNKVASQVDLEDACKNLVQFR